MFFSNWLLIILFLSMNHPLTLGFTLLIQTILMSISTGLLNYNFWFSYILFLVMISGLMIMFIYMTSIASNEKFSMPSSKLTSILTLSIITIIISSLTMDKFYSILVTLMPPMLNQSMNLLFPLISPLSKFINMPHLLMMLFLMNYLLLTLIVVVKITGLNEGALRQK
uniref:NADH-ubiquinone oxidoreductase chain 6 n=1 Tax=Hylurgops palliatus TaxID=202000 RepID=A0A343A5E1_9CUCU|nr:NADH dehydrogenase subunit 6 [Hylurgops palliatus]